MLSIPAPRVDVFTVGNPSVIHKIVSLSLNSLAVKSSKHPCHLPSSNFIMGRYAHPVPPSAFLPCQPHCCSEPHELLHCLGGGLAMHKNLLIAYSPLLFLYLPRARLALKPLACPKKHSRAKFSTTGKGIYSVQR